MTHRLYSLIGYCGLAVRTMYEAQGQHRHTLSINDDELAEQIEERVDGLDTIDNVSQYFKMLARKDIQQGVINDEL